MVEETEKILYDESSDSTKQIVVPAFTLLHIEDDELNRFLMESILEQYPALTLVSAATGRQGVELALKERPEIILTDIGLPDIDGFEVLVELRKNPVTKAIPVVALSGNTAPRDIENALAAGFTAYLTKPFNISHLFATIYEILSRIK